MGPRQVQANDVAPSTLKGASRPLRVEPVAPLPSLRVNNKPLRSQARGSRSLCGALAVRAGGARAPSVRAAGAPLLPLAHRVDATSRSRSATSSGIQSDTPRILLIFRSGHRSIPRAAVSARQDVLPLRALARASATRHDLESLRSR